MQSGGMMEAPRDVRLSHPCSGGSQHVCKKPILWSKRKPAPACFPPPELRTTLSILVLQCPSATVLRMQKGNKHKAAVSKAPKHMPTLEKPYPSCLRINALLNQYLIEYLFFSLFLFQQERRRFVASVFPAASCKHQQRCPGSGRLRFPGMPLLSPTQQRGGRERRKKCQSLPFPFRNVSAH